MSKLVDAVTGRVVGHIYESAQMAFSLVPKTDGEVA